MDWSVNFKNEGTGFVATDAVISCTQKNTNVVNATISFTWTGCKATTRGTANAPAFTFPGSNDGKPFNLDNFETLFFVNLGCKVAPAPTAAPSADADACVRTFTSVNPANIIKNTEGSTTGISFYEGSKYGYNATASLAACKPGTSADVLPAATVSFAQECFNIATSTPNLMKNNLIRQNTTDPTSASKEVIFATPLSMLFTDAACMESISSVTTSNPVCTVDTAANNYAISCSLTYAEGYDDTITVTLAQSNSNPSYTSTFMVSLPAGPPSPTPASNSSSTGVVLGVIGAVVLIGICGGVGWYVYKGRQDKDVDPYGDDATTGLTGNQDA